MEQKSNEFATGILQTKIRDKYTMHKPGFIKRLKRVVRGMPLAWEAIASNKETLNNLDKAFHEDMEFRADLKNQVEKFELRLWQLEHPAKFLSLDIVRFDGAGKGKRYSGVWIVMQSSVRSDSNSCNPYYKRVYYLINRKTGILKSCVPESMLIKAKS